MKIEYTITKDTIFTQCPERVAKGVTKSRFVGVRTNSSRNRAFRCSGYTSDRLGYGAMNWNKFAK